MDQVIKAKLKEIEQSEGIHILLAVESGSRAWGFASPDSDYDVRFLYFRPREFYLRLDRTRDVVELPLSAVLDINGWDLDKALRLLHNSNPTLFEWLRSPIVYHQTERAEHLERFREVAAEYFEVKPNLYHYLNMALGNYRVYLRDEYVSAKKYFYVLRPLLACRWILETGTPAPLLFRDLVASQLDKEMLPVVEDLLALKMSASEIGVLPRIDPLNRFIEENLAEIKEKIDAIPAEPAKQWGKLNELFLSIAK